MARILKHDKFQEGENVIACRYDNAREAIRELKKDLFS